MKKEISNAALEAASNDWIEAKEAEKLTNAARLAAEVRILDAIKSEGIELPKEGSVTLHLDGGKKVALTFKVNRKIKDEDGLKKLEKEIPKELRPWEYVTKPKLDVKGLRWIEDNESGIAFTLASCIESKPAKVGVTVKEA